MTVSRTDRLPGRTANAETYMRCSLTELSYFDRMLKGLREADSGNAREAERRSDAGTLER